MNYEEWKLSCQYQQWGSGPYGKSYILAPWLDCREYVGWMILAW